MLPYTYRIKFIPTGEYYYGVRFSKNCDPSDLWSTYFTSSKKVKNLIRKYGKDSFTTEIRKVFETSEDAIKWEHRVNQHTKHWSNYFNESDALHQGSRYSSAGGLASKKTLSGVHNPDKPWMNDPTKVANLKKGNTKGGSRTGSMPWWNNGIKDTKSIECPGEGWEQGMLPKGTYWNNGTDQRVCFNSPGEGWVPGCIGTTNKGLSFWNNGLEQGMFIHQPSIGWTKGKLPGSSSWWTNGIIQTRSKDCPGEGWSRGMKK